MDELALGKLISISCLPGLPWRLPAGSNDTQVPFKLGVGDFVIGDDRQGLHKTNIIFMPFAWIIIKSTFKNS